MNRYMELAIREAREGIEQGHGGPFGTVIVKDGKIVGRGHNCVLRDNDATCHGEVAAIRDAGRRLGTFDLSGCELYTTGEPCHMCLCACMWANISKIYYGCNIADNGLQRHDYYCPQNLRRNKDKQHHTKSSHLFHRNICYFGRSGLGKGGRRSCKAHPEGTFPER